MLSFSQSGRVRASTGDEGREGEGALRYSPKGVHLHGTTPAVGQFSVFACFPAMGWPQSAATLRRQQLLFIYFLPTENIASRRAKPFLAIEERPILAEVAVGQDDTWEDEAKQWEWEYGK